MNMFFCKAPVQILIANVSLLLLIFYWSIPGTAFATDDNVVDHISALSDNSNKVEEVNRLQEIICQLPRTTASCQVEEVSRLQEIIWTMQWLYLPKSLEQVHALYGYALSDIKNIDDRSFEIYNPILVCDSGPDDDSYSNALKIKLDTPNSWGERKFDLDSIIQKTLKSQQARDGTEWYLATDTFIPGIEPTRRFVVSTP